MVSDPREGADLRGQRPAEAVDGLRIDRRLDAGDIGSPRRAAGRDGFGANQRGDHVALEHWLVDSAGHRGSGAERFGHWLTK